MGKKQAAVPNARGGDDKENSEEVAPQESSGESTLITVDLSQESYPSELQEIFNSRVAAGVEERVMDLEKELTARIWKELKDEAIAADAAASAEASAELEAMDESLRKKFPGYFVVAEKVTPLERSAVDYLEQSGWQVFINGRIGEVTEKSGRRRRTFAREGRYAIIVALQRA